MGKLMGDQDNVRANLDSYIQGFAPDVRSIFEHFDFAATVERLRKAKLLYLVTEKFAGFNLHCWAFSHGLGRADCARAGSDAAHLLRHQCTDLSRCTFYVRSASSDK